MSGGYTESKWKGRVKYVCEKCNFQTWSENEMIAHQQHRHPAPRVRVRRAVRHAPSWAAAPTDCGCGPAAVPEPKPEPEPAAETEASEEVIEVTLEEPEVIEYAPRRKSKRRIVSASHRDADGKTEENEMEDSTNGEIAFDGTGDSSEVPWAALGGE